MRSIIAVLSLACACASSADNRTEPPTNLFMSRTGSQLTVRGHVSSTAHEAILRQTAADLFPELSLNIDVRQHLTPDSDWSLLTDMALRALAGTHSARAFVDQRQVRIRGITTDAPAWTKAVADINTNLPQGMQLALNVVQVNAAAQYVELCGKLVADVTQKGDVKFSKSSAEIGTAVRGLLDAIAEIATDCPSMTITVTGHTDNTGYEAANRALSEARAVSVVSYMIERGIAAERLNAVGAGSSKPIASNDDRAGREANRRIEFAVTFP